MTDARLGETDTAGGWDAYQRRRGIPAAQLIRALLLQALFSIPDDAMLCEQIRTNGLFRWFVGLDASRTWISRMVRVGRARLFAAGIAPSCFIRVFTDPDVARLLLDDRLRVDIGRLDAWTRHTAASGAGARPAALGSVLLLPRLSDAFAFLPYLDDSATITPLERVLRRLKTATSGPLAVTAYSDVTARALEPVASGCGVRILTLDPCSQLTQLIEVASRLHVASLAVWEPGAALLPTPFMRDLCRRHLATGHDVTMVSDCPEGVGGQIYSLECLHRMRTVLPRDQDVVVAGWVEWSRQHMTHGTIGRLLSVGARPSPVPNLPRQVAVESLDDWQRLAAAATAAPKASTSEWQPLIAWPRVGAPAPAITRTVAAKSGPGPRVLFITNSRGFSGPERMYVRLMNGLLETGVDLWGLLTRPGMIASLLPPQHRGRLITDDVEFDRPTQASFAYCLQVMGDVRPDLVHCNGIADWPVRAAAGIHGIPLVEHVRLVEFTTDEDCFSQAARLIAVSDFVRRELVRFGVASDLVTVSHDGLDAGFFQRDARGGRAVRRQLGIVGDDILVLCVARCSPTKRIETVVEALAAARPRRRAAHLLIIGEVEDQAYFESLRDLTSRCGLQPTTHFRHAVEDMRSLYAAADVFMLASVRDPLPNAVLEAMASGTPVIAAASGGIPEMLDDSTGTLVEPDSVAGFTRALRRAIVGDVELWKKARRARNVVRRRFKLGDHVNAIRRLYADVAAAPRTRLASVSRPPPQEDWST